jgi:azurin
MWRAVLLLGAIIISACQAQPSTSSTDALQAQAAPCTTDCNRVMVDMAVRDNMVFSQSDISVPAGPELAIDFVNTSRLPHNIVIVDGDMTVATEVNRDAINQADYLPQHPAVVASLPMIMPNQTGSITWQPSQPGTYLFICTYPGHFDADMYGTITVK